MRSSVCARELGAALRANKRNYSDGLAALVLILLSQLLICALDSATAKLNNFPASILAMVMVATVMIVATAFLADVDVLYAKYLRRPVRNSCVHKVSCLANLADGPHQQTHVHRLHRSLYHDYEEFFLDGPTNRADCFWIS